MEKNFATGATLYLKSIIMCFTKRGQPSKFTHNNMEINKLLSNVLRSQKHMVPATHIPQAMLAEHFDAILCPRLAKSHQ